MHNIVVNVIQSVRPDLILNDHENDNLADVLNSLDIVFIVDELENKLGISIPAEKIVPENFESVNSLAEFLRACMK